MAFEGLRSLPFMPSGAFLTGGNGMSICNLLILILHVSHHVYMITWPTSILGYLQGRCRTNLSLPKEFSITRLLWTYEGTLLGRCRILRIQ